jgi:hypothetical protein
MKKIAIHSRVGELKKPKLLSCDDNPPRLMVENICNHASPKLMPAAQYAKKQAREIAA